MQHPPISEFGYSVWHDDLVNEIKAALTDDDLLALHAILKDIGYSAWWDWYGENEGEASRYLSSTPREREKLSAPNERHRLLVVYGAINHAQFACHLSHHFQETLLGRGNDRHVRADQGSLFVQAILTFVEPWPFDEPVSANPFYVS